MENQIQYLTIKNSGKKSNSIDRDSFTCLEINIPTGGKWIKGVKEDAERIINNLNRGQANTSEQRNISTVEIDNLSGLIAEKACYTILKRLFGKEKIVKPEAKSSINQIDIKLNNEKTIEVRSSCVKNGIGFAVFTKNGSNSEQYFDVIGPYTNEYKHSEIYKDYYMRVLFCCKKKEFMSLLKKPTLKLFITGGATKAMMQNRTVYQKKHLAPAGGEVQVESDYTVVPLGKSLDAKQFFKTIATENDLKIRKKVHEKCCKW